jgi:hypothetical protein
MPTHECVRGLLHVKTFVWKNISMIGSFPISHPPQKGQTESSKGDLCDSQTQWIASTTNTTSDELF